MQEFKPFTNEAVMRAAFQQHLPEFAHGNIIIQRCQRLDTAFKTWLRTASQRKACLSAAWRVEAVRQPETQPLAQILYAKKYLDGRSRSVFEKAANARLVPVPIGAALTHLAALDAVVWTFPNDPALPHLADAIEPERVRQHLPDEALPPGCEVQNLEVEVVNYRPEIRCTAWYHLHNATGTRTLFGKIYADERGRMIYERTQQLWQKSREAAGEFMVARPAGYSRDIHTFWQEKLPGVPLRQVLNRASQSHYMQAAARRLGWLHQCGLPAPERPSYAEQLKEINKKAAKLASIFPETETAVYQIVAYLTQHSMQLHAHQRALVHGDFHLRQMLAQQERVVLFDFDEIGYGDPMEDFAHFLADLFTSGYDKESVTQMAAVLLSAWRSYTGWPISHRNLNWHLQGQLLTKAWRVILQQQPDLETLVPHYLRLAAVASIREFSRELRSRL